MKRTLLAAVLLCMPGVAQAAPFCTQITGMQPECIYYDAAECRDRAFQLKAICVASPTEFRQMSNLTGNAHYCVVNSDRVALCLYDDKQSCDFAAIREGKAVCLDNPSASTASATTTSTPPDLFRTEPNRRF